MSDESMPYEKAAEETAKAAGNAIDLIREGGRAIGPSVGNIYGILIGDRISAARDRRLDEIARKTKKILKDRDVTEQQELPEDIGIPLLEAAQGESREELQELWARLLANAMDPDRSHDVRPEFIGTLRQFQPIDARILAVAPESSQGGWIEAPQVAIDIKQRLTSVQVSFDRLIALKCSTRHPSNHYALQLTPYGSELRHALKA
jgi:hypothetical protein